MAALVILAIMAISMLIYYSYSIYKDNNIQIALTFFMLSSISIILALYTYEILPLSLFIVIPSSVFTLIYLKYRKKINDKIVLEKPVIASYSLNHFESTKKPILIFLFSLIISLSLVITKKTTYSKTTSLLGSGFV